MESSRIVISPRKSNNKGRLKTSFQTTFIKNNPIAIIDVSNKMEAKNPCKPYPIRL